MLHSKFTPYSTAVERIAYDTRTQVLTITYRTGRSYDYDSVPLNTYNALMVAASAGSYVNSHIKGHYPQRYATGTSRQII